MLKPEQVSDEVWHTAMSTYHKTIKKRPGSAWQEAIAAAINAWPGVGRFADETGWDVHIELPLLIPLPQEKSK